MKSLQKTFDHVIEKNFKFSRFAAQLIDNKLQNIGIKLSRKQLNKLERQFAKSKDDTITFDFEDEQVINAGFKSEKDVKEKLNEILSNFAIELKEKADDFLNSLPSLIIEIQNKLSRQILKSLKRNATRMLKERNAELVFFESNLYDVWGGALDLLEMFIVISLEAGESFNNEYRPIASKNKNFTFDALARLHARACQITTEILSLLKSGFADGAHARWRSLHEITVVSSFIASNGNKIAERYLLHEGIESYKAAIQYQSLCKKLNYEPLTMKELSEIEDVKERLITQFGTNYKHDYGWASGVLGKAKPTFKDIESAAGLEYMRPYYKMASYNVHANPKGVFFKLGLYSINDNVLLAGPSNVGLTDPGHSAALSLLQITLSFLTIVPNLDRLVICDILKLLADEIGKEFLVASNSLRDRKTKSNTHKD